MAETPATILVDGVVPYTATIRSGDFQGVEVKYTERRLVAMQEYHDALIEAALETIEETRKMWNQ